MVRQAEESGEPRLRIVAHHMLGFYLQSNPCDFIHAREQYEKAIGAYNSTSDPDLGMRSTFAIVNAMLGYLLGEMGFLDQAIMTTRCAVEFAREQSTAFMLGFTLHWMAVVCRARGDIGETLAAAEALESLSEEHGLSDHLGRILVARGWATARKGQLTQNIEMTNLGLETLRSALNTYERVEAQLAIAEVALYAGDAKAALGVLQTIERSGTVAESVITKRFHVQFFKGCLLATSGAASDAREAEVIFRSCLDYARKWRWKLSELHVAAGFARLMARTGRRDEARAMLAEIYGWFSEGFDTVPVRNAKALLDQLS
jgi:adenylate cyclase